MYARWYFVDAEIAECLQQSLRRKDECPAISIAIAPEKSKKTFGTLLKPMCGEEVLETDGCYVRIPHSVTGVRAINSTGWRDENSGYYVRWCFVDPAIAAAFAKEFDA